MKHTINDVLRMAGHLVLAHPTIKAFARNREGVATPVHSAYTSCWCVVGAALICSEKLKVKYKPVAGRLINLVAASVPCKQIDCMRCLQLHWDFSTHEERVRIGTMLIQVKDDTRN